MGHEKGPEGAGSADRAEIDFSDNNAPEIARTDIANKMRLHLNPGGGCAIHIPRSSRRLSPRAWLSASGQMA